MKKHIPQVEWIKLPNDTRTKLVLGLRINKSLGEVRVVNNEVVQDGVREDDLIKSTDVGSLLAFLGEDAKNFIKVPLDELVDLLFAAVIKKINGEEVVTKEVDKPIGEEPVQRTNGRGRSKVRSKKEKASS